MSTKKLYSFYWDCGRVGNIEGLLISTDENISEIIGKRINFGEVLGKFSEIYGVIEPEDFTILSEDQDKVNWLEETLGSSLSGYNPFDYLYDEEE